MWMTQEEVQKMFTYEDGKLYWDIDPGNQSKGLRAGCVAHRGYRQIQYKGVVQKEHRVVFLYFHGYLPKIIDHINGVKDDNRIENLRAATPTENQSNRKKANKNSVTGVKNVSKRKDGRYAVDLRKNRKNIFIGIFDDLEEAKAAAEKARREHHGDFAAG